MKRLLLFILTILVLVHTASAATYYVAQTAAGTEDGSSYANRMSVTSHNAGSFSPGDTIYLVDTITSLVTIPSNGTSGNRITYRGDYSGHAGILTSDSSYGTIFGNYKEHLNIIYLEMGDANKGIGLLNNINNVTIQNCTIHDMTGVASKGIWISSDTSPWTNNYDIIIGGEDGKGNEIYNIGEDTGGGDVNVAHIHGLTVSYNTMYGGESDTGIDGVALSNCTDAIVEYNEIYDHIDSTAPDLGEDGIDLKGSTNVIVQYNHVYGNRATGIGVNKLDAGNKDCTNITIRYNLIHDQKANLIASDLYNDLYVYGNVIYNTSLNHGFSIPTTGSNIYIVGNVFVNNNGDGDNFALVISNGQDYVIRNNIFYDDTHNDLIYASNFTNLTLDYNIYHYTGGAARVYWTSAYKTFAELQALGQEANGDEIDPGFVSVSTQDFTLSSDSWGIDNGLDMGTVYTYGLANTTDFSTFPPTVNLLNQDDYGTGWDIGAYVYGAEESEPWTYNASNFTYYKTITINQSMVNQSIGSGYFPLLVSITDSDLVDHAQADGDDIVFTNSTGLGNLSHEIESWNSTSGELVAWVNISDVKNVSTIRMYYNDSDGENLEDAEGVWDSNFVMVQHFQETDIDGGSGDIKDSTSNNNDGTTHSMDTEDQVSGQIDGSFEFDGTEDYITITDDASVMGLSATAGSIDTWFKAGIQDLNIGYMFYHRDGAENNRLYHFVSDVTSDFYCGFGNDYDAMTSDNNVGNDGNFHYGVMTWDTSGAKCYLDGELISSYVYTIPTVDGVVNISTHLTESEYFNGTVDEVRCADTDRSAAYIETTYNTTASPDLFILVGSEQDNAPDTKFEYYDGEAWTEGPAYYYLWFTCYWYTPECANAEQGDSQATLKITNNGSLAGTPKMKLNESAPSGIEIYVDDDNTFSGAVQLTDTYQAVSTELAIDTNVTLWAWANLSGADDWEFETYTTVE